MTATEEHLAERCHAVHRAIKEGRTMLIPIGEMRLLPDEASLILYNCPHCGSTISRRKKSVDLDTR